MGMTAWASRRWIRDEYGYPTEIRYLFSGTQTRAVERMTAHCDTVGVDSQTVKAAITTTLPTIYYPDSGTDTLSSTTGWTVDNVQVSSLQGGGCRTTATWSKKGAWS